MVRWFYAGEPEKHLKRKETGWEDESFDWTGHTSWAYFHYGRACNGMNLNPFLGDLRSRFKQLGLFSPAQAATCHLELNSNSHMNWVPWFSGLFSPTSVWHFGERQWAVATQFQSSISVASEWHLWWDHLGILAGPISCCQDATSFTQVQQGIILEVADSATEKQLQDREKPRLVTRSWKTFPSGSMLNNDEQWTLSPWIFPGSKNLADLMALDSRLRSWVSFCEAPWLAMKPKKSGQCV
jgi:hypothetical protein